MILKSDKSNCFNLLLIVVACVPVISIILHDGLSSKNGLLTTIALLLLFGIVFFGARYFVFFSKTIVLNSEGCTIKLFSYEKFYPWSYYRTIRFAHYGILSFTKGLYDSNIVFLRKIKKKSPRNPLLYCVIACPFTGFVVNFSDRMHKTSKYNNKKVPRILLADKEQFLKLLSQYQVQIADSTGDGLREPY